MIDEHRSVDVAQKFFNDFVETNEYALKMLELATPSTVLLFFIAILAAVFLSVTYILLMRYVAALVTWIVLTLTVVSGALAGYFLYFHATDDEELAKYVGSQDPETFKWVRETGRSHWSRAEKCSVLIGRELRRR